MALVKVRNRAQITLPAGVRKALKVSEGDYLDAELVEGGVILKPVTVVDREAAWREIDAARATVRPTAEQAAKPVEEQEREIRETVDEVRREHAKQKRPR